MKKTILLVLLSFLFSAIYSQRNEDLHTFSVKKSIKSSSKRNYYYNLLQKSKKSDNEKEIQPDNPDLAAEHEFFMTMDPALGYVPVERRERAVAKARQLLAQKTAIPNVHWTERGPAGVGGRTRAIMFDPNDNTHKKVWAGGVSGGLWYINDITSDAEQWQKVNDFWDNLAITSIAYNPDNTSEFYVGTGEGWSSRMVRGKGIWKTSDAGNNWQHLSSTDNEDFYYVQKIMINDAGTIFAATATGLFISYDGGNTWEQKIEGFFSDIDISANQDIYAAIGRYGIEGVIYKSTDGGASFADITPVHPYHERIELACAPSDNNTVYALASNGRNVEWIKKTSDGGNTWTDLTVPNYLEQDCSVSSNDFTRGQAWYDLIMAVHPNNPDYVIIGGIDLHRTTDGGNSWSPLTYWTGACNTYVHADQHALVFRPGYPDELVAGCDGGVFYSNDAGNNGDSFSERNKGYNVTQFYACAMKNEAGSNYFLAGAQDNGTQKFTQPGFGYTTKATGGDGMFCFIDQNEPNIQITSYVYNNHYLSTDGGSSFNYLSNDNSGFFVNPADYDNENNIMYNSDYPDSLFVINISSGSSTHYEVINGLGGNPATAITVSPNQNEIFAGTYTDIYKITNASTNPQSQNIDPNNTLPEGYISCIAVGEDANHLLVTYSSYGVSSVWTTNDGGNTWLNKNGQLPDMPVRWALFDPYDYNRVMLATEAGVWSTTDITQSNPDWQPSVDGLANVRCDMLKYRTSDDLIAIATHGRGLFTCDAFGNQTPVAEFVANKTVACTSDTIVFTDLSTKQPTSWTWSFSPNTVSFVNGTDENSQNPEVIFNQTGNYTITLTATNSTGSGNVTKTDYINVGSTCVFIMTNDNIYTCDGKYYDPGYTNNYENNTTFTQTIYPANGNAITVTFNSFSLEDEPDCSYDYLEIYDGDNTSAPLIGKYCGTNSPGTVTATNTGALTFKFFSDSYVTTSGWDADISCLSTSVDNKIKEKNNAVLYPNPASNYISIKLENSSQKYNLSIFNSLGEKIMEVSDYKTEQKVNISNINKGAYIVKLMNDKNTIVKSFVKP